MLGKIGKMKFLKQFRAWNAEKMKNGYNPPLMTLTLDTKYQVTANDKYWKLSLFINDLILKKLIVLEDLKI